MTFPSGVPDGYEYTNPDNNKVYRWDDPPGAWTFIGGNDGDGSGGTPNPPGEGLVQGTDLKIQCYEYVRNHTACYTTNTISVSADMSRDGTDLNGPGPNVRFAYSYDLCNWYKANETGGAKTGQMKSIAHGVKSNGDEIFFTREDNNTSRIWRSYNGTDWETVGAAGLSFAPGLMICLVHRDELLMFPDTSTFTGIYVSSDDGATWTFRNLGFTGRRDSTYLGNKVLLIGVQSNSDLRVSVNGGANWGQATGFDSGVSWPNAGITMAEDPDVMIVSDNTTQGGTYYCTLSDLESGIRNFTKMPTAYLYAGNSMCNTKTIKHEGSSYILELNITASANNRLYKVMKLNATNTDIVDQIIGAIPGISEGSSSSTSQTGIPQWNHCPQSGRLSILNASTTLIPSGKSSTVFGFGKDLYYNGVKMDYSPINRMEI